ncbi:MAG: hypothetical protein JO219_04650 [Candidatus Eremiobacteraeota bacterium]|nr:hypothetical protein [Candidatus Eremiobacteraeota bacterium]MBV8365556.1 hypothetical protein [Candidatus Eremiobacteraeota bacterium]
MPTTHPTAAPRLPAPGTPHYTTNPQRCVKAGASADFCAQLKTGKFVSLYWPWSCSGKNCVVGGYHVWVAGTHAKAIAATPVRVTMMQTPHAGTCYYMTAYAAPPYPHVAESKPSPKICIHDTYKSVTIKAARSRGYSREYWVLYSDNNPQVQTYPARGGADLVVGGMFVSTNQSQANTFQRAAYAFDLSSLGNNSVFGGTFEYTYAKDDPKVSCAELHRAPAGWATSNWIAPNDGPLPGSKFRRSGSTMSWPIDKLIESWNRATPLALFLEEVYGVGPAEFVKSGVVPYGFSCQSVIVDPRIVVKVGITV